jgi:hypothetical protein
MKPMAECVQTIRLLGIKTFQEWEKRKKELEVGIYRSLGSYRNAGYSYRQLFGVQYRIQFPPYEDGLIKAREVAVTMDLRTVGDWMKAKVVGLPRDPCRFYKGNGWVNWSEWLGRKPKDFTIEPFDPLTIRHEGHIYQSRQASAETEERWVEVWKLPGFEWALGYRVSNFGQVYNPLKEKIVTGFEVGDSGRRAKCRHLAITMMGNPKGNLTLVHRLVALAFVPNPDHKPMVNHIDGNAKNNVCWNLEWVTARENNYHAILTGKKKDVVLSDVEAYEVKRLLATGKYRCSDLATRYRISGSSIHLINDGRNYRYIGREDEFVYPLNGKAIKFRLDDDKRKEVIRCHEQGASFKELAKRFGLCRATVYSICHAAGRNEACPRVLGSGGMTAIQQGREN